MTVWACVHMWWVWLEHTSQHCCGMGWEALPCWEGLYRMFEYQSMEYGVRSCCMLQHSPTMWQLRLLCKRNNCKPKWSQILTKEGQGSALVKILAILEDEQMSRSLMQEKQTWWWMWRYFISTWHMQEWKTGSSVSAIALWLSHSKGVAVSGENPMAVRSEHSQRISCIASLAAINSASQEERDGECSWCKHQVMALSPREKQNPLTEWHVSTHTVKLEPVWPMRHAGWSPPSMSTRSCDPLRYWMTCFATSQCTVQKQLRYQYS